MYVYKRTESLTYRMREDFVSQLCHQLHNYQKDGHLCDVQLTAHGHTVPAHRAVLAVRSSYFDIMFTGEFQERCQSTVDLSGSVGTGEALGALINFMYTGEITITSGTVEDILGAASLLMMDTVKEHCSQYMITNLSPINCVHIWALAEVYNLKDVSIVCKTMARSRFRDFIQHRREILDTPGQFLEKLVKEGVLDFLSPVEIIDFMCRWFEHSPDSRVLECIELLFCLKQQQLFGETNLNIERIFTNELVGQEQMKMNLYAMLESLQSGPCSCNKTLKVVTSWIVATKFEDAVPEVGWRPTTTCKQTLQMHFYSPERNRWYVKEFNLPTDLRVKDFVGSMNDILIFQLEYDEILFCYCNLNPIQWKKAPDKVEIKHKGLLRGFDDCFHIFDGKLFHVILLVGPIGSSNQLLCTVKVLYLDMSSECWRQCAFEQYKGIKTRLHDSVYLHAYPTTDSLYVFLSVFDGHKFAKVSKKCDGVYGLEFLAKPSHTNRTFSPGECTISQSGDKLVVLPQNLGPYGVYDIATDQWMIQRRSSHPAPPVTSLPLGAKKLPNKLIPVDLDMVAPTGSMTTHAYEQGYLCLDVLGPYVCKLWRGAGDLSLPASFVWSELTPPSTEKLREFWVSEVSSSILDVCEVLPYPDRSEERGQSPMAHCRLSSHQGHTQSAHPIHSSCHFMDARFDPYDEDVFSLSEHSSSEIDDEEEDMDSSDDDNVNLSDGDLYNAPWLD